ncbi:hypothetical protein Tco_0420379 [Tanacetum coccineum]
MASESTSSQLSSHLTPSLKVSFKYSDGDNYNNNDLTLIKPYSISATSFQTPLASEVGFTSHMLKVTKVLNVPEKSLILPSEEVNAEDSTDKSSSRTNVQPISQTKAPTDKMTKRKRIPPPSKPKASNTFRISSTQVTNTQHTKETMATANATKSLDASSWQSSKETSRNMLMLKRGLLTKSKRVLDYNVKEEVKGVELTFEQLMDEYDRNWHVVQDEDTSLFDTEFEIRMLMEEPSDSDLHLMPNDEVVSISGFKATDSNDAEDANTTTKATLSQREEANADNLLDELEKASLKEDMELELAVEAKTKAAKVAKATEKAKVAEEARANAQGEQLLMNNEVARAQQMKKNPLKDLIPLMDEGGSTLRLNLYQFSTSRAQAQKLNEFEAKRAKMLKEYNDLINLKADPLPITTNNYKINNYNKDVAEDFSLGNPNQGSSSTMRGSLEAEELFTKLEVTIEARDDVSNTRNVVKDNLDGLGQHISTKYKTQWYQRLTECKASVSSEGLAECKPLASNLRCIQVKDIIKEVEDYLKTYSSVEMDISWYVEGIQCGPKFLQYQHLDHQEDASKHFTLLMKLRPNKP